MTHIKYIFFLFLIGLQNTFLHSQDIPSLRITNWNSPGSTSAFNIGKSLMLTAFGADSSGMLACDIALQEAISSLNGPGEIFFTKGTYLFEQSIILPDSIILRGDIDPSNQKPLVRVILSPGNNNHGIIISGTEANTNYTITYPLTQGDQKIYVNQAQLFNPGDVIRLVPFDDTLLVNNTWAYNSTGQILQIIGIDGDSLELNKPLRRSYTGINLPVIYKIIPRKQVHINCIQIERGDTTISQSSNIFINKAFDCSINGIVSYNCNFAHIDIVSSMRISVKNSFFKDAHSYGAGGKGYGIMLQSTSGDCYIHQNNFDHLRHSMILQSGANGNVLAYNYSTNPFWTETALPPNSAGDLVLHGNYPYMNLFESNVVQNIIIDNSHSINGPYNTFFKNRAELYGIFMNTSPPSHSQNFIGNQVINTTSAFLGFYALQGINHFEYGNMVKGYELPAGTTEPEHVSLFNYNFDSFYDNISTIPPIKNNSWQSLVPLIESQYRYEIADNKSICTEVQYFPTAIRDLNNSLPNDIRIYPNPFSNSITVENKSTHSDTSINIYNALGHLVHTEVQNGFYTMINTHDFDPGIYFVHTAGNVVHVIKLFK